jgi:HSP20 family protein
MPDYAIISALPICAVALGAPLISIKRGIAFGAPNEAHFRLGLVSIQMLGGGVRLSRWNLTDVKAARRRACSLHPRRKRGAAPMDGGVKVSFKSLIPSSGASQQVRPFVFLQSEIDRLFNEVGRGLQGFGSGDIALRIDVAETDKAIVLTAELPGLEEKDVQLDFTDDVLTIKGEKKSEKEEKGESHWLAERSYGSFLRAIRLPPGIDPSAIEANFAKGILTVKAPKPAPRVTKKIEIKKVG